MNILLLLSVVAFALALFNVTLGSINLVTMGLLLLAAGIAFGPIVVFKRGA